MANQLPPNAAPFSIHVVGDKTDKTFKADFVTTKILSHRQRLMKGELERQYIGPTNPQHADPDDRRRAEILATINSALLTPVPQFWRESGMGLDLLDDNVVLEVWAGVLKVQADVAEAIEKKSAAAAERLQAAVEKGNDLQKEAEEKADQ